MLKRTRIFSLCLLAVSLFVTADLALNYLNATFTELNDGIACISLFRPFFGDNGWSVYRFFRAFSASLWVTVFIAVENIALACLSIRRER